jgi:hypothetical protein
VAVELSGLQEVDGVVDNPGSDKSTSEDVHRLGRESSKVSDDDGREEERENLQAVGVDALQAVGNGSELRAKREDVAKRGHVSLDVI